MPYLYLDWVCRSDFGIAWDMRWSVSDVWWSVLILRWSSSWHDFKFDNKPTNPPTHQWPSYWIAKKPTNLLAETTLRTPTFILFSTPTKSCVSAFFFGFINIILKSWFSVPVDYIPYDVQTFLVTLPTTLIFRTCISHIRLDLSFATNACSGAEKRSNRIGRFNENLRFGAKMLIFDVCVNMSLNSVKNGQISTQLCSVRCAFCRLCWLQTNIFSIDGVTNR